MPEITFITAGGQETVIKNAEGSLMQVAVDHGVDGIGGECGGVGSCGTCHVHLSGPCATMLSSAAELERDVIDAQPNAAPFSRLACQIYLSDKHDGLMVTIPKC